MKIGYCRVSTKTKQDTGLEAQERWLKDQGCEKIYSDLQSGRKRDRPGLSEMLRNLRPGDIVHCRALDRLARSVRDLSNIVHEIKESGAHLHVVEQGIRTDESGIVGELILNVLSAIAQFEAGLITERIRTGQDNARAKGVKFGRKNATSKEQDQMILDAWEAGQSWGDIAKAFKVSKQLVYRRVKPLIAAKKLAMLDNEEGIGDKDQDAK
jgi:DNA invertase Pin-like site-specific DNA recombinase